MSQNNLKYFSAKLTQGQNNRRDNRLMKCNNAKLQLYKTQPAGKKINNKFESK